MSISERLKQIIQVNELSIKEFSEITNIPYRSIQNYLREEREPSSEALIKISKNMNIDLNWLLLGYNKFVKGKLNYFQLTEEERLLVLNYRRMPNEVRLILDISIKAISDSFYKKEYNSGE